MLSTSGPRPYVVYGQGKAATTLLTEDGCYYPVISHLSYNDRVQSAPEYMGRGARPMHRSTLSLVKPPWVPNQAFMSTTNQYYGGSKGLNPVRRPPRCRSMHVPQIKFGSDSSREGWNTHYSGTFAEKDIVPANRLHLTSLVNRINQNEGGNMKQVVKVEEHTPPNYWSQYGRIHGKLGHLLGPGVSRDYPVRQSYNILTGEVVGPAWKEENKRISGNRHLYGARHQSGLVID